MLLAREHEASSIILTYHPHTNTARSQSSVAAYKSAPCNTIFKVTARAQDCKQRDTFLHPRPLPNNQLRQVTSSRSYLTESSLIRRRSVKACSREAEEPICRCQTITIESDLAKSDFPIRWPYLPTFCTPKNVFFFFIRRKDWPRAETFPISELARPVNRCA